MSLEMSLQIENALGNYVDILPYVEIGGIEWSENDLDAPNSGRTLDGKMYRGKVASKRKLQITCLPLDSVKASIIFNLLSPEYVNVRFTDPKVGGDVIMEMYNSTRPAAVGIVDTDGKVRWDNIKFSLIER